MARRLILDTTVLVDYERRAIDRDQYADDEIAVAAVTVAELRTGIELADTAERKARRAAVLEALLSVVHVLPYGEPTAVAHGRLLALVRRSGRPRGAHDLIIAAHAVETGRILVTHDAAARFGDLPEVVAEIPA